MVHSCTATRCRSTRGTVAAVRVDRCLAITAAVFSVRRVSSPHGLNAPISVRRRLRDRQSASMIYPIHSGQAAPGDRNRAPSSPASDRQGWHVRRSPLSIRSLFSAIVSVADWAIALSRVHVLHVKRIRVAIRATGIGGPTLHPLLDGR